MLDQLPDLVRGRTILGDLLGGQTCIASWVIDRVCHATASVTNDPCKMWDQSSSLVRGRDRILFLYMFEYSVEINM